jgi:undecaprenyl phosphate N,N'-diacetylbacillosamine 1-phosphate transferase
VVKIMEPTFKGIYRRFLKRPGDIVLSFSAILLLSPIFLVIAALVKIKLGSPVLFRQKRPGLHEEIFTMYKFRTMKEETDAHGKLLPDSSRLTSFGKGLRSTSLDELPELFNILKGHMSIVGPRPLLEKYLPYYTETEKLRHTVRPGLTGLAQISGRNELEWTERLALDVDYVKEVSFLLDMKIIIRTIQKVLQREGIIIADQASYQDLDIERRKPHIQNNACLQESKLSGFTDKDRRG